MKRRGFIGLLGMAAAAVLVGVRRIYREYIMVMPGESVQDALDEVGCAGGGCVVLAPGSHKVGRVLLTTPSNSPVMLRGSGRSATRIKIRPGPCNLVDGEYK